MDKIMEKLLELENERECLEKYLQSQRKEMGNLIREDKNYLKEELIFNKCKEELKEVNKKIEILNEALDIVNNIK